jgi:hypothetical protein
MKLFSSTETTTVELSLDRIRIDGGTQPRAALDYEHISELAQDMLLTNTSLKPVIVYYDGTEYWLADGFHRYHAAKQVCRETIDAEVKQGTRRDAILYSVGANSSHGKRRTNDDKRRSVETLLGDDEWGKWSNREIARRCYVTEHLVRNIKDDLNLSAPQSQIEPRYVERSGTIYTMNTTNIGQRTSEAQEQQAIPLTLREMQALEPQPGPLYGATYQSSDLPESEPRRQESLTPQQFFDEVMPGFTLPPSFGLVNGQPFTTPLPDGNPIEVPENWKLPEEMREAPLVELSTSEPAEKPEDRSHFMQIMTSSETPEWYTPEHIVARVIELFGEIDLDPCSNSHEQPSIPAHTHYTKDDDGLSQEWNGKIYMNPPYGTEIAKWTAKLVESHKRGTVEEAIALLPGRIDTSWFQPLYDYLICNIRGRLQFSGAEYSAPFPSVAVYMGDRKEDFKKAFKTLGPIVERVA